MGTSNLYKGPNRTQLIPYDYAPDDVVSNDAENQDSPLLIPNNPSHGSWKSARKSMTDALKHHSDGSIKRAIKNYTKALGGHRNATRQATTVKDTTIRMMNFFSGSPEDVYLKFNQVGISFEGRTTREIFLDIRDLFRPDPATLEDALANRALEETFTDVANDGTIDLTQLESFSESLLQHLVGGMVKHYIFDKLLMQVSAGALKAANDPEQLKNLEGRIKVFIDGIVDRYIPDFIHSGIEASQFSQVIDTLFDAAYKEMEEMQ